MLQLFLHRFYPLIGFAAFGGTLAAGFLTGSDPLWSLARAAGCALVMLMFYSLLCHMVLLLFDIPSSPAAPERAAPPAREDADSTGAEAG